MSTKKTVHDDDPELFVQRLCELVTPHMGIIRDALLTNGTTAVVGTLLLELLKRDLGKANVHQVSPGDVLRAFYNVHDIRQWSRTRDASQYRGW
ncbi:hypothetical protein A3G69_05935 [Candidatus Peribacteria bacterium RIFCSPLOWO2_12_FULL_53_10]|nr:MAG: hypothetical protein A3G69_05935 [Candidatus Peribacteria bacterium RIFCSPLOWO2_12_FULL_53_10]